MADLFRRFSLETSLLFIYRIVPVKTDFLVNFDDRDREVMTLHAEYLRRNLDAGVVLLAGPCEDAAFGICIFQAESLEDANRFAEGDPAIANGIMHFEVHPFRVSFFQENKWW